MRKPKGILDVRGAGTILAIALLALPALAQAQDAAEGIKYEFGGGIISVFGKPDAEVQPTAFLGADMPILPRTRLNAQLALATAPGDTPDFTVGNFRSLEVSASAYVKLYQSGAIKTSLQCTAGFNTLDIFNAGAGVVGSQHFQRRYGCGPRIEDGQGFELSLSYGRDQLAGPTGYGQGMIGAKVPIPKTAGVGRLYFKSTVNVWKRDPAQRDYILFGVVAEND
jgi:hypothetical protein